jgi:hypothetical protein
MITLTKNGTTKTIGQGTFDRLKGNLDGWIVIGEAPKSIQKAPPSGKSREQMMEALKEKGVPVHPNIGDEKLKQRYHAEIENNQ